LSIDVSWKLDSLWQSVEVSSFSLRVIRGCCLLTGFASRLPVGTGQDLTASISDLSVSASWFWLGDFSIVTILWSVNLEIRRRGEEKKNQKRTRVLNVSAESARVKALPGLIVEIFVEIPVY
jgi:hypothetical protein